jgi:hypothetical protein
MNTIQIRCKAFIGESVKINKINVDATGAVRVWDSVAGHYTSCHSLTPRSIGKIQCCLAKNNMLRPIAA